MVVTARRWILGSLAALVLVTSIVYLVVRDPQGTDRSVRAGGSTSSSSSSTTSTPTTIATTTSTSQPVSTTTAAPAPTPSTVPTTQPAPTTQPPPFRSAVGVVTAEQLGASWHAGCPIPVEGLRAVDVSYWGNDGAVRTGRLIVHTDQTTRVVAIFRDIYAARFPIARMRTIDAYGGDDEASMRDNNTSGFNCRYVMGTTNWSEHAYGRAIDVNPLVNPYVRGSSVDPPEGAAYADRSRTDPGMIHAGDAVVRAFAAQGWGWGGSWSGGKDYQHFSASGR